MNWAGMTLAIMVLVILKRAISMHSLILVLFWTEIMLLHSAHRLEVL